MTGCYECDGEGWVDEGNLVICDACDGYGDDWDEADDEYLSEEEEDYLAEYIQKILNHRGFVTLFTLDFENKTSYRNIYFQWRSRKWLLLKLPTNKRFFL